jgi:hypothetical protein
MVTYSPLPREQCARECMADNGALPLPGMGNRFSTLTQYHSLILGHGVLAAITFLFIIPIAALLVRFYAKSPGKAIKYHAYLNIVAVGLSTVVFVLGFIAVGPPRNLTNPHHGIGVAIYVLILLQAFGGRLVRKIQGRSFRLHIHRWSGRILALLGVIQVPLGLTLYGSPKYTFILYALWMAFLVLLFFILDYREGGHEGRGRYHGGDDHVFDSPKKEKKSGGWLAPAAAAAAGLFLLKRKKNKDEERGASRSRSRSRTRAAGRSRSRGPEVIPSPRQSDSYYDEKSGRQEKKSGFMNKLFMAGAGAGAATLVGKMLNRGGKKGRDDDSGYSAVATDTPSRFHKSRRVAPTESEFTDLTESDTQYYGGRRDGRSTINPVATDPIVAAAAISAAEQRPMRPRTPPQTRPGRSRVETIDPSDYSSSYVSPSRRASAKKTGGGMGKGLLAGLGLGFLAKKVMGGRNDRDEDRRLEDERRRDDDRRREEEDRRAGRHGSRYTGDGHPTPTRADSRRRIARPRPPPSGIATTISGVTDSSIEPRGESAYDPVPPVPAGAGLPPYPRYGGAPPVPVPVPHPGRASRSHSRPRYDVGDGVAMPPIPNDPHGLLHHDSSGESAHPRHRVRRGDADAAAAVAAASAGMLAAEEEDRRRRGRRDDSTSLNQQPVSVKVKVDHDRDRNITFRRLTGDETASASRERRRRADSVSSQSEVDTPTGRRYRRARDSSGRRTEAAAESHVESESLLPPLSPPNPAFAQGKRPKDSAYYSGQPGPSGGNPAASQTVSSLNDSPAGSHGGYSALSPAESGMPGRDSAADRRRRRRIERREGSVSRPAGTVEFD